MSELPLLTILMATYNGGKYLIAQLESILAQTYQNWELVIRDDNSTDTTQKIITEYLSKDKRLRQLKFGDLHGTACRNFSQLFDWACQENKQYILFADQDDIWLPDKIELSLKEIKEDEKVYGFTTPLAKYSSFEFIDEEDNPIDRILKLPAELTLRVLLNENYAWGCTMILNRAAVDLIKHIPPESVNHDYYIALVVSAFGRISLINKDLVLYRQHQNNVSGNVENMGFSSRFDRYFRNTSVMIKPLTQNYALVKSFYEHYSDKLSPENKRLISGFLSSYQSGFFNLLKTLFKFGIFKIGLGKNLVYIYTLFLYRKKVIDAIYKSSKK
ncbi:glycosyltransferase family 2 protein [Pedobacter rhodius]|uniref:Glycosyltransferase family 2 protein n=1 Tax=Pedobacter rhodius TaxID=3004098 RepID=A0ABT4KZR9_9SPHI|nr:glycosyltransferase family 2 protein [Pedobacter sp. SJ11]MCZ4224354.1 glycosyltransferase family 2 protein [Pedobacter sp. SJ11]